ncbi:MAG: hypothetical protein H6595_07380 [Flavobacteriales bacterium]|nr:hypothetical protein [Flavobacteriales bacterium]MCB9167287.1 hypothetical protein [Flavobacteriales bacterium]
MRQLHKSLGELAFAAAMVIAPALADAQCRSFVKHQCLPDLAPYKFNEQFNGAQLAPGEDAEVSLTFFSGQEYRVMVCAHPILGEVNWKLVDGANKIIFESLADDPKHFFDLKMASTQQLKLQVWVPNGGSSDMVHLGCVAILVGFKE